jgi:hypothetical protein
MNFIKKTLKFWIPALIILAFVHGVGVLISSEAITALRSTGDVVLASDTLNAEITPYVITGVCTCVAVFLFIDYVNDKL